MIATSIRFVLVLSLLAASPCPQVDDSKPPVPAPKPAEEPKRDYGAHAKKLEESAPEGFSVVIQKPFVVIGDEPAARVKQRAEKTVKWVTDHLKESYFDKDPETIIDVWLFKNKASYEKYTKEIFDDEPTTPFGYYSSAHRALIMNIGTGGGTLCHEIVHPFIESNFPGCPSWFNEGLASLYEQCGERKKKLVGFTNWRLEGLQKAIRAGTVPTFEALTSTTTYEFYNEDRGTNYAQARYLCYYLQQDGLLRKFYKIFRARSEKDRTGYETLKTILGDPDMKRFQEKWERFVLKLEFPERD